MKSKQALVKHISNLEYQIAFWADYDFSALAILPSIRRRGMYQKGSICNAWIMGDTETSKKPVGEHNHVCAWSISIRSCHNNIVSLWGRNPLELLFTIRKLTQYCKGDIIIYFHNLAYDYIFLRKFLFMTFGTPNKQLATKSHYPILIEWDGLILKDSLILAQRKLEKWADDLGAEHKKAVGKWEYNKIRTQNENFTSDELLYIVNDTLAGVECLDILATSLKKNIQSIPFTATGIIRDHIRKVGKLNKAHDLFERLVPSFEVNEILESVYHGGYTHGNRYFYDRLVTCEEIGQLIRGYDFKSSYPFCMLTTRVPMSRFIHVNDRKIADILRLSNKYAFITLVTMFDVCLKDLSYPMPMLQKSKCVELINPVLDNGRVISADIVKIYLNEIDLQLFDMQYNTSFDHCSDVYCSNKDYLPRWFRDEIFELFKKKCTIDKKADPIAYGLAKSMLNSSYGMCCQHTAQVELLENYVTGEYKEDPDADKKAIYAKYVKRQNSILLYQWGCWITSAAMYNLFRLGSMCGTWIYSDTDSVYGYNWDDEAIKEYNKECLDKLTACGYGPVNGQILGVAELDSELVEFKQVGAKRYCYRKPYSSLKFDDNGETIKVDDSIQITVAGVPKKTGSRLIHDVNDFTTGFIFPGTKTGKLTHKYIYVDNIYEDPEGCITADSIDLTPCDYLLKSEDHVDYNDTCEVGIIVLDEESQY